MANANQLKALFRSHFENDKNKFKTIALQLAASEARKGHSVLATDLKKIIDSDRTSKLRTLKSDNLLGDIIEERSPNYRISNLVSSKEIVVKINRILDEYHQQSKLKKHGLDFRRKILLTGPPGTGKTMTAELLSKELKLPFFVIQIDKIMTKYMGETATKLRQVFDTIQNIQGVYLFDEFDAIAYERSRDNELGEMRRVLNSFLQFLENDNSGSFLITATNNIELIDQALFRRFDDILFYKFPSQEEFCRLVKNKLKRKTQVSFVTCPLSLNQQFVPSQNKYVSTYFFRLKDLPFPR